MHGVRPVSFPIPMLATIATTIGSSLANELEFYQKLSAEVGDFRCSFIERYKNTRLDTILSIEYNDQITLYVGSVQFKLFKNLHEAIWYIILLHIIFRIQLDERIQGMAGFFAGLMHWKFIRPNSHAKDLLARISL